MGFFKPRNCEYIENKKKCGKEFMPKSTTQKYCKKCGIKNKKNLRRKADRKWRAKLNENKNI